MSKHHHRIVTESARERKTRWRNWRSVLAKAQGGKCYYCGCEMDLGGHEHTRKATIDHKIPLSLGGADKIWNAVAACWWCNHLKDNLTDKQFFEALATPPDTNSEAA